MRASPAARTPRTDGQGTVVLDAGGVLAIGNNDAQL
jgi:hypothetical protein